MRFLIVAAAVFACATAVPSGALLAASYSNGLLAHGASLAYAPASLAVAHAAPVAVPTISPGDIQGAVIDAHVKASDNVRAAVDAVQQVNDQAKEIQGRALNAAEDHAWQAVNAAQVAAAQVDGAAAGISPIAARQLAGHSVVAPAVVAPAVAAYSSPVVAAPAISAYASPLVAARAISGYAAPAVVGYSGSVLAAPAISAYSSPLVAGIAASKSVSVQSLSQSHPAPLVHAPAVYAAHAW